MIRFIPDRSSLSASLKEERVFDSLEELRDHLYDSLCRFCSFIGSSECPGLDQICISDVQGDDPLTGYKNVRTVTVSLHSVLHCVGLCGE